MAKEINWDVWKAFANGVDVGMKSAFNYALELVEGLLDSGNIVVVKDGDV